MKNKVCASIITYNIDKKIIDVVNSVINQVEYVVIIDNGSSQDTISILKELGKKEKVELILNQSNNGIAKALNQGVEFAKSKKLEWILTLDHDSICDEHMIENMLKIKELYPKNDIIGVLTPQVFEINKQDFISIKTDDNDIYMEVNDCIQSGAIFKIELFDKIGYFNEELFIYHVDFDYCQRVLRSGYKIIQCNNTILHHEEGYKIPKKFLGIKTFYNNYSSKAIYYITRNTIYMCKNYSIFYVKRIIKDFVYILAYDNQKVERLSYWKKGLFDGILNKYGKLSD